MIRDIKNIYQYNYCCVGVTSDTREKNIHCSAAGNEMKKNEETL